jgi:hypothetical protein
MGKHHSAGDRGRDAESPSRRADRVPLLARAELGVDVAWAGEPDQLFQQRDVLGEDEEALPV